MSPLTSILLLALVASSSAAIALTKELRVKIDLNVDTIIVETISCAQCSAVDTVTKVIAVPASLIPPAQNFVLNPAYIGQLLVTLIILKKEEVTSLVLIGFNIAKIAGGALSALPNLQSLDVAYNNINNLAPNSMPSTLITLIINGNPISSNDIGSALNLHKLMSLSMMNCGLSNLTGVLGGVPNLEKLDISDNKITNLDSKCLPSALTTLSLSGNPLSLPETGPIINLSNLIFLSMSNCDIRELSEGALGGVPNLKIIDLSKNQISTFPAALISGAPLETIYLDDNLIQKITKETFSKEIRLQVLSLADNQIDFSLEPFLNAPSLTSLILDNNLIQSITPKTFSQLLNLEVLSMKNHRIKNMSSLYFRNLSQLTELNLESPTMCLGNQTEMSNWANSSHVVLNANCMNWSCGRVPVSQPQCMYI